MTVGRTVRGDLTPPVSSLMRRGCRAGAAIGRAGHAAPDRTVCPSEVSAALVVAVHRALVDAMLRFLNAGGGASALETALRDEWALTGEGGAIRTDLDLTGEGTPDVLASYTSPEGEGTLLVLGCANGTYAALYQALSESDTPPEALWAGDMNNDQLAEIVFANQVCPDDDCTYQTQLVTWKPDLGRFVSLLERTLTTDQPPELRDIDNDAVSEVVVSLKNRGNKDTGPLRTGVNIYDWNGAAYVLSIVQYDPPRFRIQVVQEADRARPARRRESHPDYELRWTMPASNPGITTT
jgi:hypothetical protein